MSRSSKPNLVFDSEIEKTVKGLRKQLKLLRLSESRTILSGQVERVSETDSCTETEFDLSHLFAQTEGVQEVETEEPVHTIILDTEGEMADPRLCDLASHDEEDPPTPVRMTEIERSIEIKLGLLNVLPKFYGKKNEDPYNFLSEFIKICKVQKRPEGITEDQFKLAAFPFTLTAEANAWFNSLAPNSVTSWTAMKKLFLEHFFPPTKTNALKKEITGVHQEFEESLSSYWTRFKKLVDSCPNHKFSDGDLLQYFYQGMNSETKNLVNSSSGGGFSRNTVSEAKKLIQNLVEATREYDEPNVRLLKRVAQTSSSNFEEKFEERMGRIEKVLNTVVEKVASVGQKEIPCGTCGKLDHSTIQCRMTEGDSFAQEHVDGVWEAQPQKRDPFSNSYNPGWRDHPNFHCGGQGNQVQQQPQHAQQQQSYRPPHQRGFQPAPPHPQGKQGKSLEDMMGDLIGSQQLLTNNLQTNIEAVHKLQQAQKEQKVCIDGLAHQVSQLTNSVNEIKESRGIIHREQVSQVTLRSGKELRNPPSKKSEIGSRVESEKATSQNQSGNTPSLAKQATAPEFLLKNDVDEEFDLGTPVEVHEHLILDVPDIKIPAPFPERLVVKKPKGDPMDFMSIFGKMEINMPFLQAIKLPELSKFMREFIAGKSKKASKIVMSENVSAVIQSNLPAKCKDPGMFSLPCSFGDTKIKHAMCDLGASINVMPLSVYNRLNGVELVDANVVIQLADKSCVYPVGLLENVLVKVHDFVYPADFYVVEMNDMESKDSTGVLLGRPFLRTARTVIDVFSGTICLDYNGEKFTFNIDDTMKNLPNVEGVSAINVTNPCVQEPLETNLLQDKLELTLTKSLNEFDAQGIGDEGMKTNVPSLIAYLEEAVSGNTVCLPKRSTCNGLVSSHMLSNKCEERKKKRVKKKKPRPKFYDAFKWYEDLQRMYYDKKRMGKTFEAGQKVLYESKLSPEPGKFKTGWFGPFEIQSVYETGAIMIKSLDKAQSVLVNCHKLQPYLDASSKKSVKEISQSPQTSS